MNEWMSNPPVGAPPSTVPVEPRMVEPPKKMSMFKKIVIVLIVVGVLGVAAFAWFTLTGTGRSLNVGIIAPETIQTGVPVDLSVTMENSSGSSLKDVQVSISLPAGLIFVGVPGSRSVENRRIGAIEAGKVAKETFKVMAIGIENSVIKVQSNVSYVPGALSSRFEKQIEKEVIVGEAGIRLSLATPVKSFGGEEFSTEVSYQNLSETTFDTAQLKLVYPVGFSFKTATLAATDTANSIWDIGPLAPGDEEKFIIKGFIVGQDNENFELKSTIEAAIGEESYEIAVQKATIAMAPSPLSVRIGLVPNNESTFSPGETLQYRLTYTNNTQDTLRDVIVRAKFTGEMFDMRTVDSLGVLRASDSTVVWRAANVPSFTNLAPNATGQIDISVQTKSAYPITRLSSKNYTLTIHAEIESPTVPRGVAADKTLGMAEMTTKMNGLLRLNSEVYYRDAVSGITNNGVFPPKVGQPTQFTIHWILINGSTDVEQIRVKSFLGPNVRYTGISKLTAGASSTLKYNDRTQEVVWNIPRINATRGIISDPIEAIFQVELTPAINQAKDTPDIIQRSDLDYRDLFTGRDLSGTAQAVSTGLPDDRTLINLPHAVIE